MSIQPNLFDRAISSTPRMRAWTFSSARSGSRPANDSARAASKVSTIAEIGSSRKSQPRLSASSRASVRVAADDLAEPVLVDVVAQPELERESHLLELVDERHHAYLHLAAVLRRATRADVDDLDGRNFVALARERAAANVAQAPSDDLLGLDVCEQQRLLESGSACDDPSLVVEDDRVPVEDQLVLPADGVTESDETGVVARSRDEHLITLAIAADVEGRRGDVHEQLRAGERQIGRRRSRLPHVLADGRADERLPVLEQDQVAARREVTVLVEDAVIRQKALAVHGLDLAARADVAGVVEVAVETGSAHEDRGSARLACDALDRVLRSADEPGSEQQIFRGIAGDCELRKDDKVGAVGLRLGEPAQDQLAVPIEVADDRVDLGKRQAHVLSLAVSDSEAKT